MAITDLFRRADDQHTYNFDDPSSTQNWVAMGDDDPVAVDTACLDPVNGLPPFDENDNPLIEFTPKHVGGGVWEIEVRYGSVPPLNTGLTLWEVDTTGGREKKYQSLNTRNKQVSNAATAAGYSAIDFNGAIGVNETQVEGVDVAVPKMALTAKRKFKISGPDAPPSDYVETLENLTATINAAEFSVVYWGQILDFKAGELLFLGAVVSIATETELEVDCRFEASRDRLIADGNAVNLVGFPSQAEKQGWDYAWISYMNSTSANTRIKPPQQYQTEKVYQDGDFTALIL